MTTNRESPALEDALPSVEADAAQAPGAERSLVPHPRIVLDPGTLESLRQRARNDDPLWIALRDQCDAYVLGTVEWPDGDDYPDDGIGEGYQGDEYFPPVANLGLAYRVAQSVDPARAAKYGAKGAEVLFHMSAPESDPHAPEPLRDQGYGIRYYGLGMALGFDWLYDAMSPADRTRVADAINRWIDAFATGSFARDHPQGNYFAGYYATVAIAGLATEGDDPRGAGLWEDFLGRLHGQMVQPYYDANLGGGGWPEGVNYGPLATFNMTLPVLGARTAKGIDLVHAPAPYRFPSGAAHWYLYNTWPSLLRVDDRGTMRAQPEPAAAPVQFVTELAGMMPSWDDPLAPAFHAFARDVRAANPDAGPLRWRLWSDFLFWDEDAPEEDYTAGPRSGFAPGMEMGAVRSSWRRDAVWGSLNAGPYTNNPNSGEQLFDSGSLAIAHGNQPFLVNAAGQVFRGTSAPDQFVYEENYGPGSTRGLFNVFYTDAPTPPGQEAHLRAGGARTHMGAFEEGSSHVFMRAGNLEDMYPREQAGPATITSWTRDVAYVRPDLFVVYDRTTVTDSGVGQWIRWHFAGAPGRAADPSPGVSRHDIGSGETYAGTMTSLLPAGHVEQVTPTVFEGSDVSRIDVRPGTAAADTRWLTVFQPGADPATAARAIRLSAADGNVLAGDVTGVLLESGSRMFVVLYGTGAAGEPVAGPIRYRLPAGPAFSLVADLEPGRTYAVTATSEPDGVVVEIAPGPGPRTSPAGVLSFMTP